MGNEKQFNGIRNNSKKFAKIFTQFFRFGIVGITNTVISYILYAVLVYFGVIYAVANFIAFAVSVLWSFFWNNRMVFTLEDGEQRSLWKALLKTFVSYSFTGLILATILLWLQIDVIGINKYIAPIVNLIITVPINFVLNRNWAFRVKRNQ